MDKTFVAKKMGEVLAFCMVGAETFERGQSALNQAYGEDIVAQRIAKFKDAAAQLTALFPDDEMKQTGLTKAEATGGKLRQLRDIYVGDEWDNATELSEWSGFFEGAGRVHWELVQGAAQALQNSDLAALAESWVNEHNSFLDLASAYLRKTGAARAA